MKDRFKQQGFLGIEGQGALERVRVAICGLGGGGSHLVTQLAYMGVTDYALFDADIAKPWNLNRTITLTEADVAAKTLKIDAAERRILQVRSKARIETYACRWQERPDALRGRDIVFGSGRRFQRARRTRSHLSPEFDSAHQILGWTFGRPQVTGRECSAKSFSPCRETRA